MSRTRAWFGAKRTAEAARTTFRDSLGIYHQRDCLVLERGDGGSQGGGAGVRGPLRRGDADGGRRRSEAADRRPRGTRNRRFGHQPDRCRQPDPIDQRGLRAHDRDHAGLRCPGNESAVLCGHRQLSGGAVGRPVGQGSPAGRRFGDHFCGPSGTGERPDATAGRDRRNRGPGAGSRAARQAGRAGPRRTSMSCWIPAPINSILARPRPWPRTRSPSIRTWAAW